MLDEGYSPPERETDHLRHPEGGESLDERLADEEPEVWAQVESGPDTDEGVDGDGASAEEAAMRPIEDDEG